MSGLTAEDLLVLNTGGTAGDNPGTTPGQEEHGFNLDELGGDNFVRRSLFDAFNETGIELINTSGSVDLTIDDTLRHIPWNEEITIEFTAPEEGAFEYICPQHAPKMQGSIRIE